MIKKIFKIFFVVMVCLLTVSVGLNLSGFCFDQGKWLSDEEKFARAARIVISNGPNINYMDRYVEKYRPAGLDPRANNEANFSALDWNIYHKEWREKAKTYYREHPDCCKIAGHGLSFEGLMNKMTGYYWRNVEVRYPAPFIDKRTNQIVYLENYTETPPVSNCGRVRTRPAD